MLYSASTWVIPILIAITFSLISVFVGLTTSYYADLAPGGTIVLVSAGVFVIASVVEALGRRLANG